MQVSLYSIHTLAFIEECPPAAFMLVSPLSLREHAVSLYMFSQLL